MSYKQDNTLVNSILGLLIAGFVLVIGIVIYLVFFFTPPAEVCKHQYGNKVGYNSSSNLCILPDGTLKGIKDESK